MMETIVESTSDCQTGESSGVVVNSPTPLLSAGRQRGSSIPATGRRGTVQLAREVLLRRLTRVDITPFRQFSFHQRAKTKEELLEEISKHLTEVNHLISSFHQLLLHMGTSVSDSSTIRQELTNAQQQCLKSFDTARNSIVPHLKSDPTMDSHHSGDFTQQAYQFIGSLNLFITDLRRYSSLLRCFPSPTGSKLRSPQSSSTQRHTQDATGSSTKVRLRRESRPEVELVEKDIAEAEAVLESIENAITVHFSTDHLDNGPTAPLLGRPKRRGKCQFGNLCLNCKTNYA